MKRTEDFIATHLLDHCFLLHRVLLETLLRCDVSNGQVLTAHVEFALHSHELLHDALLVIGCGVQLLGELGFESGDLLGQSCLLLCCFLGGWRAQK